jgi:hypothetical protein
MNITVQSEGQVTLSLCLIQLHVMMPCIFGTVSWIVTPCGSETAWLYGETSHPSYVSKSKPSKKPANQAASSVSWSTHQPWKWRRYIHLKLQGVTIHNIITGVRSATQALEEGSELSASRSGSINLRYQLNRLLDGSHSRFWRGGQEHSD